MLIKNVSYENFQERNTSPVTTGTIATLVCEFGNQDIGGATSATCVEGGWSHQLATCQPLNQQQSGQCQPIAKVSGGNVRTYLLVTLIEGIFR